MDLEQKKSLVHSYTDWWHRIDFGDGLVSDGMKPISIEDELQIWDITEDYFKGKSVLDIGAADGGFSFFAERAGASKVVAFDQKSEARPLGSTRGFEIAKEVLGSNVELVIGDIDQPDALTDICQFEIVFFAGVFYHLENPFIALRNIKSALVDNSNLFLETNGSSFNSGDYPHLQFHPKNSLNGDYTNFFSPNPSCVKLMLEEIGGFNLINNSTKIANDRFWQHYEYNK